MFSKRLSRLAGPALTLGGLLWITIHIIVVIGGLMTGKLVPALPTTQQPLLAHIYYFLLPLSYLVISVGLLGGFAWLDGRARRLGITGFVLASIATITSIIILIFLAMSATSLNSSIGVLVPLVNALNGLSTLSASVVLGCAVLRVHMLPRPYAWILIVIGIVTLPILLLTPLPIGPTWATDTIAFFLSGIGYTVVGLRILVERKRMDEHTKDVSFNVVAQAK
jgi:hypothetical protein